MKASDIRKQLTTLGYRVKLSRRNGIRTKVEVIAFGKDQVLIGGGDTDLEAFETVLAKVHLT